LYSSRVGTCCSTGLWHDSDMSDSTRGQRLRKLVQEIAGKPAPEDEQESLFESGLLDSFALPDLVSAIEKEFAIKVPDSDLNPRKFDSIARMDNYLAEHM
jgi:acyl carrier protein